MTQAGGCLRTRAETGERIGEVDTFLQTNIQLFTAVLIRYDFDSCFRPYSLDLIELSLPT